MKRLVLIFSSPQIGTSVRIVFWVFKFAPQYLSKVAAAVFWLQVAAETNVCQLFKRYSLWPSLHDWGMAT